MKNNIAKLESKFAISVQDPLPEPCWYSVDKPEMGVGLVYQDLVHPPYTESLYRYAHIGRYVQVQQTMLKIISEMAQIACFTNEVA